MPTNTTNLRNAILPIKKNVPVPYARKDDPLMQVFHKDAIILLTLSDMLVGDSADMPPGTNYEDMQRLAPPCFPLIFTYHMSSTSTALRVWRIV
jgi:hypothetical protein